MLPLRDEDFEIWEEDKIKPRKKSKFEIMQETLKKENKYYENKVRARRENIHRNRDAMDGILHNDKVKNLFELDEIDYKTAIKLDFFTTLEPSVRKLYIDVLSGILEKEIQAYLITNNRLGVCLMEFKTAGIFAKSALNHADKLCLNSQEFSKMSKDKLGVARSKNYQKFWEKYQISMERMENLLLGSAYDLGNNIQTLSDFRVSSARNVATYAKMLDNYELLDGSDGSLYFYGAITLLKQCSLPRETLTDIQNSNKTYVVDMSKGFMEMYRHRSKSDLVVTDCAREEFEHADEVQLH